MQSSILHMLTDCFQQVPRYTQTSQSWNQNISVLGLGPFQLLVVEIVPKQQ